MFEPQDHPNDFRYPGGPPIPPYDATGYTLAFQMGVQFDRILDGFDGPFERVTGLLDSASRPPSPDPLVPPVISSAIASTIRSFSSIACSKRNAMSIG